jgi:hypothetical protein
LLAIVEKEKTNLDFCKISLTRQRGAMSENGTEIDQVWQPLQPKLLLTKALALLYLAGADAKEKM